MTYILCKSVGFTHEEALTVAAVDQGMDDSTATNAHDGGKPQIEEEWRWHALDKDGKMSAKGVVTRRDFLYKEALEETDPRNKLIRLGIFFHYQQDTWAHRHHEKSNHLSRDAYTTFNTPTGHGPWGSKPDRPPLDPVAAFMCLEDGVLFASEFLRENLKREPTPFLSEYAATSSSIDKKWKDKKKGKYFNQLDISKDEPGSPGHFLKSLVVAQINSYSQTKDYNPFYFRKMTPDLADFDTVRTAFQGVWDNYEIPLGETTVPSKEDKLSMEFTNMTTDGLLSLSNSTEVQ